jgi:N-methylhydantoinase A/oxoprolinase/acetone carboxylase beta subunit
MIRIGIDVGGANTDAVVMDATDAGGKEARRWHKWLEQGGA